MNDGFLKREWKFLAPLLGAFLLLYHLPVERGRVAGALVEAFALAGEYAREHVLLCLVPAFFIAGAISVFLRQDAVMRYLGPRAAKPVAHADSSTVTGCPSRSSARSEAAAMVCGQPKTWKRTVPIRPASITTWHRTQTPSARSCASPSSALEWSPTSAPTPAGAWKRRRTSSLYCISG